MNTLAPLRLARTYAPGIGQAVADRTINRLKMAPIEPQKILFAIPRDDTLSLEEQLTALMRANGHATDLVGDPLVYEITSGDDDAVEGWYLATVVERRETWQEVADRVAHGNVGLIPHFDPSVSKDAEMLNLDEFAVMQRHLRIGTMLMSGRHLQHGDKNQYDRPQEVFCNCATSAVSHLSFLLLLSGAGVGRAYDDAMMVTDYSEHMPTVVCVIDPMHADAQSGEIVAPDSRNARHLYNEKEIVEFRVPDSREGWAQAIEMIELLTYQQTFADYVLMLDFSDVREKGSPIKGMQNRPASGPGPLIQAIENVARIKGSGMKPWRAALYVDHYMAECVLVGGARRAARMSTKRWTDPDIFEFINVKDGGYLWSSNNSVTVDAQFWDYVEGKGDDGSATWKEESAWALAVFNAMCEASYKHGTGEPGFINQDQLVANDDGIDRYTDGTFARSNLYQQQALTEAMMADLARRANKAEYSMITNPCGEIALFMLGGYCVIGDVVPYHAGDDDEFAEEAFRQTVRALMRVNTMDCLYKKEVKRTNRIGVSMTGIHEYALSRFGMGFRDLIDEKKAKRFWAMIQRFALAVEDEARSYAAGLDVTVPHTMRTIKPAGTTSKLFGLSEGAHLAAMREYIRWVQFRSDDPLIDEYKDLGYPIKRLTTYSGTTIVGFPTKPEIIKLSERLGAEDQVVIAIEATPEEQYQWVKLLEKYWINAGGEGEGSVGNQVSYTLKYDPDVVSFEDFKALMLANQRHVRCCTVMPTGDTSAYEYLPEEAVTKHEYEMIVEAITAENEIAEDIGEEHVDCATGACPIDFGAKAMAI